MRDVDYYVQSVMITCDECNDYIDYDFSYEERLDYDDLNDFAKREGYLSRKIDGEWCDFCCQECYQKYLARLNASKAEDDFKDVFNEAIKMFEEPTNQAVKAEEKKAPEYNIEKLTASQEKAFELLKQGKNVFLTGEAGTGKSFLIKRFLDFVRGKKNVVISAPTGIAAINVGGTTIHRLFGFNPKMDLTKVVISPKDVLRETDILIIDEISMCRMDLFDAIGRVLDQLKNHIQVIVVGDFCQLPPVLLDDEREKLEAFYKEKVGNAFAFQSQAWKKLEFETVNLVEIMRQSDAPFINALNKARKGEKTCLKYFINNAAKKPIEGAVTIVGTNKRADNINNQELAKLPGETKVIKALVSGDFNLADAPTSSELNLKVGARVIFLINSIDFKNGTTGTIESINGDSYLVVRLDKGYTVFVTMHTWENIEYTVENEKVVEKTTGTFTQYPIKLAYAITVHKSQGQTYDSVNLEPCGWVHGQLYVALSRCKDINKLYIAPGLKSTQLICDKEVKELTELEEEEEDW